MDKNTGLHTANLSQDFGTNFEYMTNISKKQTVRVQKGMVFDEFYTQKIIQCRNQEEEMWYRHIVCLRKTTSITQNKLSCFRRTAVVESRVDTRNQQIKVLLLFMPFVATEGACKKPVPITVPVTKDPPYAEQMTMIAARTTDIINKSIVQLMVHSNQQLYTYETFLYDANTTRSSITLNTTSFVGMGLILNNQQIEKEDFKQIFQLFQTDTLDQEPSERLTLQHKIRALGMLLLSCLFQMQFKLIFKQKRWKRNRNLSPLERCKLMIADINKMFERALQHPPIINRIKEIERINELNYLEFLKRVFVREQKLSWNEVIRLLVTNQSAINEQNPSSSIIDVISQLYHRQLLHTKRLVDQLGLMDHRLYLIALLEDENIQVERLLAREDIDGYLYSFHNFNPSSRAIYLKLTKFLQMVCIVQFRQYQRDNIWNRSDIDCMSQLKLLVNQFGIYTTKVQNKYLISAREQTLCLSMYARILK